MRVKVKDRITLGVLAAVVGGMPTRLLNAWAYRRGYLDFCWGDMASSVFYSKLPPKDAYARFVGRIANQFVLAASGVVVAYVLSATGRDKAMLKGAGILGLQWLGLYGLVQRLGLTKMHKSLSDIYAVMDHMLTGALTAGLVSALGDDSLFPDAEHPLPLVGTKTAPTPATAE